MNELKDLLRAVADGAVSVDEAALRLKAAPFADLGFAKVDLHRKVRTGSAEVIYGAGKTAAQINGILDAMLENGQKTVLITRLTAETARAVSAVHPIDYRPEARVGILGPIPKPTGLGKIVVATQRNIHPPSSPSLTFSAHGERSGMRM